MEYGNSSVVQPPPRRLGQTTECRRWGWVHRTLALALFLAFTGCFAAAAYGARHRARDLVYSIVIYFLLVLLVCCVVAFERLRLDHAAAAAGKRRAARIALWVVSLTLTNTTASRVADAAPEVALKLSVWAVAVVVLGIVFYYLFRSTGDAGCCHAAAEHGRGQAYAGRLPSEKASREMSPEEKV